jgi:hypothetical protein
MITHISVIRCEHPVVNDIVDRFDGTPHTVLTFDKEMDGADLIFTVYIAFFMEYFDEPRGKADIAKYFVTYKAEIDNGGIKAESLYEACRSSVGMLVEQLRFPAQWRKIPRMSIVCPTLLELKTGLQEVVDWYNSRLN